jgi:hypothetical protein
MAVAPSFVMQARRDREEEMIHRGTEYARAVKKYYKKFGRYPASLEQLDNTNQIRFLRRRFKDPLTKDGEWKLLHYGDIALLLGANGGIAGLPGQQGSPLGGSPNSNLGANSTAGGTDQTANTALGAAQQLLLQQQQQQQSGTIGNQQQATPQQSGGTSPFGSGTGTAPGQSGFSLSPGGGQNPGGASGQNSSSQTGTNNSIFGNTGVGGQTFGGGAIVGVASKSKDTTIRIFNKKKTYDEWMFIYNPMMDIANTLLRGPFNGQTMANAQIGTPAGQLNQQNQGQQPGGFGQQPSGFGQQNPQQNQQLTPGNQFPPDQSQPH